MLIHAYSNAENTNENQQETKPYKIYFKRSVYKLDFPKLVNNARCRGLSAPHEQPFPPF